MPSLSVLGMALEQKLREWPAHSGGAMLRIENKSRAEQGLDGEGEGGKQKNGERGRRVEKGAMGKSEEGMQRQIGWPAGNGQWTA